MSNGELLIVWNIVRNGSLWSNVVFNKKRSIFPWIWFRDLRISIWGLEIKHKAHNLVWQGCFFLHYYLATSMTDWAQISTGL